MGRFGDSLVGVVVVHGPELRNRAKSGNGIVGNNAR